MSSAPAMKGTEAAAYKIEALLSMAKDGRLRIPAFQRPPRWKTKNVLELYDSLYRGYPIGTLLLARKEGSPEIVHLGAFSVEAPSTPQAFWVVDGQQRVAALAGALLHPNPEPRSDIHAIWFDLAEERFFRLTKARAPETAIPLRALGDPSELLRWLRQWPLASERPDLEERALELSKRLREYQVPCALVDGSDEQPLRIIFARLNDAGVAMQENEVFDALFSKVRGNDTRARAARLAEEGFGHLKPDFLLRCALAVAGIEPQRSTDQLHDVASQGFLDATETALTRVFDFLTVDCLVPHLRLLPYRFPIIPLARFFHFFPTPSPRTRLLLRRWLWRGFLSQSFSTSSHGTVRRFQRLIDASDSEASALALLAEVGIPEIRPIDTQAPWNARSATSLYVALALVSRHPRDPRDESPLTIDVLQGVLSGTRDEDPVDVEEPESKGSAADSTLGALVIDVVGRKGGPLAGRLVLRDSEAVQSLLRCPNVWDDHLLPESLTSLLAASEGTADRERSELLHRFDADRGDALATFVTAFLWERCEPSATDRPSIRRLASGV